MKSETVSDFNVESVKADGEYLKAKDFKEGKLVSVTIVDLVEHKFEETKMINGEEKNFAEHWNVLVEQVEDESKTRKILRLSKKMVTQIRDDLKYGSDMNTWIGKRIALITKKYNVGMGWGVVV